MTPQTKMLIDCENRTSLPGYAARDKNGQPIELIWSGKYYNAVQPDASEKEIYQMFETHCGLIFMTDETPKDLSVYPVPIFVMFATDLYGNYFGSIGGFGDILEDGFPIGFVNKDGRYGKVARHMKAFLELAVFYPRWRECLSEDLTDETMDELCKKMSTGEEPIYPSDFAEIIMRLGLTKKPESLDFLLSSTRGDAGFVLYEFKEEAGKFFEFLDVL